MKISGIGFSNKKEDVKVSVGTLNCDVEEVSYKEISCILDSGLPSNSNKPFTKG